MPWWRLLPGLFLTLVFWAASVVGTLDTFVLNRSDHFEAATADVFVGEALPTQ
jgi:hypothetical protein